MRISSGAIALLMLNGCSGSHNPGSNGALETAADVGGERIDCAPAGTRALSRQCSLDRAETAAGLVLTVHKPDGGFRRLLVVKGGRGVIAADGAEPAKVAIIDKSEIDVTIGGDRFRLPATIKGQSAKATR